MTLTSQTIPEPGFIDRISQIIDSDENFQTYTKEELDKSVQESFTSEVNLKAAANTIDPKPESTRLIDDLTKEITEDVIIQPLYFLTELTIERLKFPLYIPPKTFPIYSYNKKLVSQNVLGKPLEVYLKVTCSIIVYHGNSQDPSNTIKCSADLTINLAGNIKNVHLFDFSKLAQSWSASANFGGSWGVGIVIPLPPPVSFIQISLNFNIGYNAGMGVYISIAGTQVIAGSYVTASLVASAEAGVRVLFV